jgi:hypothetical protein
MSDSRNTDGGRLILADFAVMMSKLDRLSCNPPELPSYLRRKIFLGKATWIPSFIRTFLITETEHDAVILDLQDTIADFVAYFDESTKTKLQTVQQLCPLTSKLLLWTGRTAPISKKIATDKDLAAKYSRFVKKKRTKQIEYAEYLIEFLVSIMKKRHLELYGVEMSGRFFSEIARRELLSFPPAADYNRLKKEAEASRKIRKKKERLFIRNIAKNKSEILWDLARQIKRNIICNVQMAFVFDMIPEQEFMGLMDHLPLHHLGWFICRDNTDGRLTSLIKAKFDMLEAEQQAAQ